MKRLYILAPNDRFNYGDLLFPHIIYYNFKSVFDEIIFCSTSDADLTDKGGHVVKSFHVLYNVDPNADNYLIVAGGECLCVSWIVVSYINKVYDIIYRQLNRITRKWNSKRKFWLMNSLFRNLIHGKTFFPFSIGRNELPNFKGIFYNAVGGGDLVHRSFVLKHKKALEILESVDYISVRDSVTELCLKQENIHSSIVADSAILMSEVFSEKDIKSKCRYTFMVEYGKYIFFQANEDIVKYNLSSLIAMMKKISGDYTLCLCPIGTAYGHRDDVGLKILHLELQKIGIRTYLVTEPSIFDIMWLIKHSALYIGSSLHGVITAMSFGVPYCGYCAEKVARYISTWGDPKCFSPKVEDIINVVKDVLENGLCFSKESQKTSVKESFVRIKQIISKT